MQVHINLGSLDPAVQKIMHAEIKRNYQSKVPWTWEAGWLTRRIKDIELVLFDFYGNELPDDDSGFDDVRIMLFHMAKSWKHNERTMRTWIMEHARWALANSDNLIRCAIANKAKKPPSADKLAEMLGVTYAMRKRLGLTTIGANDFTKRQRNARRKQRRRERDMSRLEAKRRAKGAKPRADSAARTKPWEAEGISRRTWYRHRKMALRTTSSPSNRAKPYSGRPTSATERTARLQDSFTMEHVLRIKPHRKARASGTAGRISAGRIQWVVELANRYADVVSELADGAVGVFDSERYGDVCVTDVDAVFLSLDGASGLMSSRTATPLLLPDDVVSMESRR